MPKPPSVTICIPTHNRAPLLTRALNSALAQTYPNINIVISDNCSKDDTAYICKQYQSEYQCVSYVSHVKPISAVENFCFLVYSSQTEFIYILADDDYLAPSAIEELLLPIMEDSSIDATCCYSLESAYGGSLTILHKQQGLEAETNYQQLMAIINPFSSCATAVYCLISRTMALSLYPRKPIKSVRNRDLWVGDESYFLLQILCCGRLRLVPKQLHFYQGPQYNAAASQAIVVSQNLSNSDLISFYIMKILRFSLAIFKSHQVSPSAKILLFSYLIYSHIIYIATRLAALIASRLLPSKASN